MIAFEFPPLGSTGEGKVQHRQRHGEPYWTGPQGGSAYYVTRQEDRPAVAFRCHYPGGSSPCDEETAKRFIDWVKSTPPEERVR